MTLRKNGKPAHRLWNPFRGDRLEGELAAELKFHLQKQIEKNIATGMTSEEARCAALRMFGGVDQVKEQCREVRGMKLVETVWQDVRYATRTLSKNVSSTAIVVLSLALGIGANSTMFSVINAVLLKPLGFKEPDRLAALYEFKQEQRQQRRDPMLSSYLEWHRSVSTIERMELAVTGLESYTISGSGEPERINGQYLLLAFSVCSACGLPWEGIFWPKTSRMRGVTASSSVTVSGNDTLGRIAEFLARS